jgi:PleD family two-component response regulator
MPADYDSLENMIKMADDALYSAKERGRGTFLVAEPM